MVPVKSPVSSFWDAESVKQHLRNLRDTVDLAKALQKELEEIHLIRRSSQDNAAENESIGSDVRLEIAEMLKEKRISLKDQESLSLHAAYSLISALRDQLVPFGAITNQGCSWEEKSMAVRLAQKLQKSKRNKCLKKKKRKYVAELQHKERDGYDKANQDADEWRAREIVKDMARCKVESMKAIAKLKVNEEKKKLESELELVLVVEKLQELRSIRIHKLKKQGHLLPEEDDKFLDRVRIAVEEEERHATAAADTDAAKDAIATAALSQKIIPFMSNEASDANLNKEENKLNQDRVHEMETKRSPGMDANLENESCRTNFRWRL